MISCNIAVSMQMPRERGVLSLMLVRRHATPDVETWCAQIQPQIAGADSELLGLYHSPFTDFI